MKTKGSNRSRESGQVLVLIMILIVALVGMVGVAVDGGRWYAARRSAQNGADNAALAAALAYCFDEDENAAALASALSNGFNNDGITNTVEINHPPLTGPNMVDDGYIEVVINSKVEGSFTKIIFAGDVDIPARAVGFCVQGGGQLAGGNGILVLDSDNTCAFNAIGNGSITVHNGGIMVNSNNGTRAACATGNAVVNADAISVVGGVRTTGNADFNPTPSTGAPVMPDPLNTLAAPPKPGGACLNYSISANDTATIDPGKYCSISATANAVLTLNPGVYYIDDGNFSASGNASLTANEVMIYLEDGDFSLSGNGNFNISAPTSGDYQGMMLFMAQANVSTISITGNGMVTTTGTIYGALATANVSGNGSNTVINSQLIANMVNVSGNGDLTLNYNSEQNYGGAGDSIISLVE